MLNLPSAGLRARIALDKHGFATTHSLGQNFLLDDALLNHLLDQANVDEKDNILEIGPGPGVMTSLLAQRCKRVVAVELDERLRPVLTDVLAPYSNASVEFSDFLKTDVEALTRKHFGAEPYRVVANLPYYITADILMRLVTCESRPECIDIMVQREAVERLMSRPGSKNWCALAATVRYYGECEVLEDVPPQCFNPPPHVDSCFLQIRTTGRQLDAAQERHLFRLIQWCFHMRRKTLVNNLKTCCGLKAETAVAALEAVGLAAQVRGEALSLEEMIRLSEQLRRLSFPAAL